MLYHADNLYLFDNRHFEWIPVTDFWHWVYLGFKVCRHLTTMLWRDWPMLVGGVIIYILVTKGMQECYKDTRFQLSWFTDTRQPISILFGVAYQTHLIENLYEISIAHRLVWQSCFPLQLLKLGLYDKKPTNKVILSQTIIVYLICHTSVIRWVSTCKE